MPEELVGKINNVHDLDGFEPCGLFDAEIQEILDNDNLAEATSDTHTNLAREDPETGDVWTLCWVRLRKQEEKCITQQQPS